MSNHDAHHFSFTNFSPFHVNLWRIFLIFGARTTIVLPFCGNTNSVHSIQAARLSSQCRARNRLHFLGSFGVGSSGNAISLKDEVPAVPLNTRIPILIYPGAASLLKKISDTF